MLAAFLSSLVGFAFMVFAPAELSGKTGDFSLYSLLKNFVVCVRLYYGFKVLLIAFIVLLVLSFAVKANRKSIYLSVIFLFASLLAMFIFSFASYFVGRFMCASAVFLILSCAILVGALNNSGEKFFSFALPLMIVPSMLYNLATGLYDIHETNYAVRQAIEEIEECKDAGILEVPFPYIHGETTYSVYYSAEYQLDMENPDGWPNSYMAKYFGVDRVVGTQ